MLFNLRLLFFATLFSALSIQSWAAPERHQENELRAAVINGILHYTDWKKTVSGKFCLIGDAPSADTLIQASGKLRINRQPAEIEIIKLSRGLANCDVLVIGELSGSDNLQLAKQMRSTTVLLSICDGCNSQSLNTNIEINVKNDRIGFNIILMPDQDRHIQYRSALMELANSIVKSEAYQ